VYILVSRAVGTATLLAMHNRNVLLVRDIADRDQIIALGCISDESLQSNYQGRFVYIPGNTSRARHVTGGRPWVSQRAPVAAQVGMPLTLLNMFRRIGTVLICPANGAPFASTRHRNVLKSASNRDTGSKLAAGPVYSDGRTQILMKNKVCRP
jgi:hypothetical protein